MASALSVLRKVRDIELKTRGLVESLAQGSYHSVFKGRGIEFSDVREYQYGDDVRAIDWNVTARMNHPYVKEFIEERDLTVLLFVDVSASGNFGSQSPKKEIAIELAASIALSAARNNDRVGLFLSTTKIEKYLPPRKGRRHALKVIRELVCFNPKERGTSLSNSLSYISKVVRRRSIVFLISDFIDDPVSLKKPLSLLSAKNDVIAVRVSDPRELELPDVGLIELEDGETGEQMLVDTSSPEFSKNFSALAHGRTASLKKALRRSRVDIVDISTSESWAKPLMGFFKRRAR